MFIVLGFYKRRPDLTHEQFSTHWRDVHGPLIRRIANDNPGLLVRYVQHHLSPDADYPALPGTAFGGTSTDFDGFSEGWFASKEARDTFFALPIFGTEGLEDEQQFLDLDATRWVVLDNQSTIIPGSPDMLFRQ